MGKKDARGKMDGLSKDVAAANRETLRAAFPGCFSEGRVDWATLAVLCGENCENSEDAQETPILRGGGGFSEKYSFEWPGKRDALRAVGRRSAATLRPVPSESVDFETTRNLYIEGDNLEVLRLLQESYFRKVKMIYIDPPYNTGNDFVYNDDFADPWARYLELTSQTTKSNPETAGRFHSNWLNMMYPRLRLAANLLRDDGVIFISIDDREVCNLRKICDEIFGEENFVAQVTVVGNPWGRDYGGIARMHDYLLIYQKTSAAQLNLIEDKGNEFKLFDAIGGFELRELRNRNIKFNKENRPNLYYPFYIDPKNEDENGLHPISLTANVGWIELYPLESQGVNTVWRWGKEKAGANLNVNILAKPMRNGGYMIVEKYRESRVMARSVWGNQKTNTERGTLLVKELLGAKVFDYPKPLEMLKQICELGSGSDGDDIILDFFSGSGTTAHAVMKLNVEDGGARRFVLVQLPELCAEGSEAAKAGYRDICEIGKERLRRAGAKLREERNGGLFDDAASLDVGFKVFRLDTSNWELWDDSPTPPTEAAAFLARLRDFKNARKSDRSDADALAEIALKSGLPLDVNFETRKLVNVDVYVERGARFCALLQDGAEVEDVERLLEAPPSERPEKIVVAESAFRTDAALSNVAHLLEENGIEAKFI